MASETLEEKKPEDVASVEEKEELKDKEDKGEVKEEEEEEEEEEREPSEKEEKDEGDAEMSEKDVSRENEVLEKKGEESKEEGEGEAIKKGKRSRKASSKKVTEDKEGQEKEKKPRKESSTKEPVTPIERPTRERKLVERYSEPSAGRTPASKGLLIEKGSGTQLKDIPNVAFKLSKRKPDDCLQTLHTILFGKKAKAHSLKKNIGQFSGYVWVENEKEKQRSKVKEKLDKCIKEKLMDFCDVLNIPINKAKKDELSVKLLEFLESPHATTDVLLADKEQKGKKRKRKVTPSKNRSSGEASIETPSKKRKQTPEVSEKGKQSSKVEEEDDEAGDKAEPSDAGNDSHEVDDDTKEESDPEQSEEDEPKKQISSKKSSSKKNASEGSVAKTKVTPVKKGVPAKSSKKPSSSTLKKGAVDADGTSSSLSKSKGSAAKKQKVEKGSASKKQKVEKDSSSKKQKFEKDSASKKKKVEKEKQDKSVLAKEKAASKSPAKVSAKDQGKGKTNKKAKVEPSREEMHRVVVGILKEVDFNTATLSDILRQLGTHFGVDLMHRKAEVKDIITDVINNMTDEEDEGEEGDGNSGAGDDADKDDDDDDDDDA